LHHTLHSARLLNSALIAAAAYNRSMTRKIVVDEKHAQRVRAELIAGGMTSYGLLKGESRHLPELIHEDEHIGGVVYGRYEGGSGMIVATDKRILFLDHKLFFMSTDELNYDVVSGVSLNKQDGQAGVVLHTRLGDYKLKFVNGKCATKFTHYIENKAVEIVKHETTEAPPQQSVVGDIVLSRPAKLFLASHDLATLSTIDADGNVHGAVVYYTADKNDNIFIVTKDKTAKAKNLASYHQVALTIFDAHSMQTLQISGAAQIEEEPGIKKMVEEKILRPRFSEGHAELPPILHIPAGKYVVICIRPLTFKFNDYKND
jgi:general stress protein 26